MTRLLSQLSADPGTGIGVTELALALLATNSVTAVVTRWLDRRERHTDRLVDDLRLTQDRLQALRRGARLRARTDPAAPDDNALADLADALESAANLTLCDEVVGAVRAYVEIANLYAVGDPDNGEGAEQQGYADVADALRARLKRRR